MLFLIGAINAICYFIIIIVFVAAIIAFIIIGAINVAISLHLLLIAEPVNRNDMTEPQKKI